MVKHKQGVKNAALQKYFTMRFVHTILPTHLTLTTTTHTIKQWGKTATT